MTTHSLIRAQYLKLIGAAFLIFEPVFVSRDSELGTVRPLRGVNGQSRMRLIFHDEVCCCPCANYCIIIERLFLPQFVCFLPKDYLCGLPRRPYLPCIAVFWCIVTHANISAGVGMAFSRVCLSLCLFVRILTGKRLELSTPNLVLYSIEPEVRRSRSHICHGCMVARDYVPYSAYQYAAVLPAAVAGVGLHVDTTACVIQ